MFKKSNYFAFPWILIIFLKFKNVQGCFHILPGINNKKSENLQKLNQFSLYSIELTYTILLSLQHGIEKHSKSTKNKSHKTKHSPVEHTLKTQTHQNAISTKLSAHTRQTKNPNFALKINTFTQVKSTLAGWLQKFTFLLLFIETLRKERKKKHWNYPNQLKKGQTKSTVREHSMQLSAWLRIARNNKWKLM